MCSITYFSNKEKEQNAIKAPENTAIFGHYVVWKYDIVQAILQALGKEELIRRSRRQDIVLKNACFYCSTVSSVIVLMASSMDIPPAMAFLRAALTA